MIDLQLIREKTDWVKERLLTRGDDWSPWIDRLLAVDQERRQILRVLEDLKHTRNVVSRQIGELIQKGQDTEALKEQMRQVGDEIAKLERRVREVELERERVLLELPNIPDPSVPVGADEKANVVVAQYGRPKTADDFKFEPIPHWDLGPRLGILDFERGVKLAGSRFYVLFGAGALLERALINWMLDLHTREHGYTEVWLPAMVKEACMWGAAQLPWLAENIYRDVEDNFWFIGTAEIPLTNLHRDEILPEESLPLKYVAYTPCFRREKFSAGKDVRGIKRGHQFDKVELYKVTTPETSNQELDALIEDARDVLVRLELPHRIVQLATGDLAFHSARSYDIEVWAPGCKEWLEVSSCSNCTDFQARRVNLRYRPSGGGRPRFAHTLNGSGLALPRTVIALLENYQDEHGRVFIPSVLQPYLGGLKRIPS
ncbi:MAG: serine--tRNA ligase [Armatimonadetes bacterium]|nr:serine--tRNA ligase [Armatimonadota bacterium]MDW8122566.1 serine--tRNA ligase [Armatimonadota bacterium]